MADISYELSLTLAPFVSVSLERTGTGTGTIHVELDPRHANMIVHLMSMGVDPYYADDTSPPTHVAQVFALINDYDPTAAPIAATAASTKRSFAVALSTDPSVKDVGVLGTDPDSADDNGQPNDLSAISSELGNGGGEDPLPIDVVIRKKRIPIPAASGQTSVMVNVLIVVAAFVAGVVVGKSFS